MRPLNRHVAVGRRRGLFRVDLGGFHHVPIALAQATYQEELAIAIALAKQSRAVDDHEEIVVVVRQSTACSKEGRQAPVVHELQRVTIVARERTPPVLVVLQLHQGLLHLRYALVNPSAQTIEALRRCNDATNVGPLVCHALTRDLQHL